MRVVGILKMLLAFYSAWKFFRLRALFVSNPAIVAAAFAPCARIQTIFHQTLFARRQCIPTHPHTERRAAHKSGECERRPAMFLYSLNVWCTPEMYCCRNIRAPRARGEVVCMNAELRNRANVHKYVGIAWVCGVCDTRLRGRRTWKRL